MANSYKVVTSDFVNVFVTSTVNSFHSERKFPKDTTISQLKSKLELLTGASHISMVLQVFDKDDKLVATLDNDDALLGSYPVDDGMRIHAVDTATKSGLFEDTSQVDKYEMSKEEYAKRDDSVRSFLQKQKLGKYNEEQTAVKEEQRKQLLKDNEEAAQKIKVGDRCEVKAPGNPTRRGVVAFLGEVHFKPGMWVGVKFDEPLGKNDGSVDGKRYFECPPKYGGFVRPLHVTPGDFPEESLDVGADEM